MTVKELKDKLAEYPDDMEVAIDDGDMWLVIDYIEPNYGGDILLIGNYNGLMYQH